MLQPSVHRSAATSGASAASTKAAGRMVSCVRARECCSRDNCPRARMVFRSAAAAAAPGMEIYRSKARQEDGKTVGWARPGQARCRCKTGIASTPGSRARCRPRCYPYCCPCCYYVRRAASPAIDTTALLHSPARSPRPTRSGRRGPAVLCRRVWRRAVRLLLKLRRLVRVLLVPERLQRRVCGPAGTPTYGARRTIRRQDVTLMAPRDADRVPSRAGAAARSRQEAPPEAARDKGRQGQVPRTQSRQGVPLDAAMECRQRPLRCAPRHCGIVAPSASVAASLLPWPRRRRDAADGAPSLWPSRGLLQL